MQANINKQEALLELMRMEDTKRDYIKSYKSYMSLPTYTMEIITNPVVLTYRG